MPTWGEILREVNADSNRLPNGMPDFDKVRRKYVGNVSDVTGRNTFLYVSAYLGAQNPQINPEDMSITLGDVQGFMEVVAGTDGDQLDLILHSPGGYAEAAESIMNYLRTRFSHIRVIVPHAAMSAATMMALGADEIVMGKHSQLGPIDPQITIATPEGPRGAPAKAILDQFELAKEEVKEPSALPAWLPILRGYGPGLLAQCEDARELAESIVAKWLENHMLRGSADAADRAKAAAKWFAEYENFGSHSRGIAAQQIVEAHLGLNIVALEDDQALQDAVLSTYHASTITFRGTAAIKLVENQNGKTYAIIAQPQMLQVRQPQPAEPNQPPNTQQAGTPKRSRAGGSRSKRKKNRRR